LQDADTWQYSLNETDHTGEAEQRYELSRAPDGINLRRQHRSVRDVERQHDKTMKIHRTGHVEHVVAVDKILLKDQTPPEKRQHLQRKSIPGERIIKEDITGDIPNIETKSVTEVVLTKKRRVSSKEYIQVQLYELTKDNIEVPKQKTVYVSLEEARSRIGEALSCIHNHTNKHAAGRVDCVVTLRKYLKQLSPRDLVKLGEQYLEDRCQVNDTVCQDDRHLFIDLIIRLETKEAQQLIVQHVLDVVDPHEEEIQRTMYHMHALKSPTSDLISTIAKLCFGPLRENIGKHINVTKNERRACLAIGSLARYTNETNHLSAENLVAHLENWLEHHDEGSLSPPHHRGRRSPTFFNRTEHHHKVTKMVLLEAIGNAGSPTSLDHILSYAKPNMGHPAWRRTAVNALRSYTCHKSATALIDLAVNDDIDLVRQKAYTAYNVHPKRTNVTREQHNIVLGYFYLFIYFFNMNRFLKYFVITDQRRIFLYFSKQYTYHTVMRLKRGVLDDILKALSFKLEVPGIQWTKEIGNDKIGASFGLEVRNKMELKLGFLSGFFDLDSYNTAFVEAHIGLLNIQADIFRALACYHGFIEYDLNILKDFGINDIHDLAKLFDKIIDSVRLPIIKAINAFKKVVSLFQGKGLQGLFNEIVKAIRNLPNAVKELLDNLKQFVIEISDYEGLPWIAAMKRVVRRVRHFVEDVQTDILGFYNAVVDAIAVNLPYTAKTIAEAIELIIKAVQSLFKNPMGALSNIGKAIMKIKLSISMIIGTKIQIEESCFFLSGKMPYWMNLGEEFTDLMDDITEAVEEVSAFLERVKNYDFSAARPLNVGKGDGMPTMEEQERLIIQEFLKQFKILLKPFEGIVNTSKPFLDSYNAVMEVVDGVKSAYHQIRTMVEKGKSIVMKLFGPKFHAQFPSHRSDCDESCGCGKFPYEGKNGELLPGIDVMRGRGSKVESPVTGTVKRRGDKAVLIEPSDQDFASFEIIVSNIEPIRSIENSGTSINAGDKIGKALHSRCDPNFIHVAMRKKSNPPKPSDDDYEYVDPTPYIDRIVPVPQWIEKCNEFSLTYIGQTSDTDSITDPENAQEIVEDVKRHAQERVDEFINNPPEPEPPYRPEGMDEGTTKSLADSFGDALGDFGDLGQLIDFSGKKKPPSILDKIDINSFEMRHVLLILKDSGLSTKHLQVERYVESLAEFIRTNKLEHPENFSPRRLKYMLQRRGQDSFGSFEQLVMRYIEIPEGVCPNIKRGIARGFGHFCTPHRDCQGLTCGLLVKFIFIKKVIKFDMRLNTCSRKLDVQIDNDTTSFDIQGSDDIDIMRPFGAFDDFTLMIRAHVSRMGNGVDVTAEMSVCSAYYPTCTETMELFKHLYLESSPDALCKPGVEYDGTEDRVRSMRLQYFVDDLLQLNVGDRRKLLTFMNELRSAILDAVINNPGLLLKIGQGEFPASVDFCFDGDIPIPTLDIPFFDFSTLFMIGPVPLRLEFGAGGAIGIRISVGACLISMKANVKAVPWVGGKVWGALSIDLFLVRAGIKIVGYLLETRFPITGTLGFAKFPIAVSAKMDLELVPVKVKLTAFVELYLIFARVMIYEGTLWEYKMEPIRHTIFDIPMEDKDESPAEFGPNTYNRRKKRWNSDSGCTVKQLSGRDYTDPAFILEATCSDPVSDVKMFYAIGSHPGGTDVSDWTEMGGSPLTVPQMMIGGIPLYWTVKARNSQGLEAFTQCMLHTYDVTLPDGRLEASHAYTSHPHRISGTLTLVDDSPLKDTQYKGVGFGQGATNAEVVNWQPFSPDKMSINHEIKNELSHFSAGRTGKLTAQPIKTIQTDTDVKCAKTCLDFGLKCVAFDYDYKTTTCDLHEFLEGAMAKLATSGAYHNFERIGVGHTSFLEFDNLDLQHGEVYYINTRITNELGYTSIISTKGTLVDFTPPEPGPIGNASVDVVKPDGCSAAVTQRCIDVTWQPNHRYIRDGPGSNTVFNGHHPLKDTKYTLANHYMSANWDGFHDNETDIWGYTWAAGSTVCGTDVQPYDDPHSHLSGKSFWTHNGLAKHLHLADGPYYVTVQALNNVHYGGSLVTTVCHTRPIIVDTTRPIFNGIDDVIYDEDFDIMAVYYNVSDPLSGIMRVDFALGKTKYDAKIRPFSMHDHIIRKLTGSYLSLDEPGIPDGVPVWVRVRAVNNVELFNTGHGDEPIMIDRSDPIPGELFDGNELHIDSDYQANNDSICVHWKGFYDPESGIDRYSVQVGGSPGSDDVVKPFDISHSIKESCMAANLTHNTTYYATVTAFNHGLNPKSVNRTSDGILIDMTNPIPGWAVDGLSHKQDVDFSAETATVSTVWGGFHDPESDIDHYEVSVLVNREEVDAILLGKDQHFEKHTFSLHHGDTVQTTVRGLNGAGLMSSTNTDGYSIDLTPPVLKYIIQSEDGLMYQASDSYIYGHWQYGDEESGILEYRVTIFQLYQGQKQKLWPSDQHDETFTMMEAEPQFVFNQSLQLINGAKYSLHVTAMNRALLSASHETTGVIIDTTPPKMKEVHIGLFEEEEELDEQNRVLHVDSNGIEVSWLGHDGESGIIRYLVGVGVKPGDVSVTKQFIDFGSVNHGYIPVQLNVTASTGYTYYVTVIALNGAGLESHPCSSKPIVVLRDNVPGTVSDGREFLRDSNSQKDTSSIACSFVGFESEACGITAYEWAIGSAPGLSDIRDYSSYGIVMVNETSGIAQGNLDLPDDQTVYTVVRATTGHNCHEDFIVSVSDGITVDASPPNIIFTQIVEGAQAVTNQVVYEASPDNVVPKWNVSDTGSGMANVSWKAGRLPGYSDKVPEIYTTTSELPNGAVSAKQGETIFLTLTATDNAGNQRTLTSPALVMDATPPVIKNFKCTDTISHLQTTVHCEWKPIVDVESKVKRIQVGVGSDYSKDDLAPFSDLGIHKNDWMIVLKPQDMPSNTTRVFVTLKSENLVHLSSISVAEIAIDTTPPLPGLIHITTSSAPKGSDVHFPKCQVSGTYVEVLWEKFHDLESDIDHYELALGSYFQGTDVMGFHDIGLNTSKFIDGLALPPASTVYASVRGFNKGGLYDAVVSEGTVVSPHPILSVVDGSDRHDVNFQTDMSSVSAYWDYQDPCPLQEVLWSVVRVDGVVIKPPSRVPPSDHYLINDETDLENDKTYYSIVTIVDVINRTQTARSNGFTVKIEPPIPGYVADGHSADINYQQSTTHLSAHWGPFGDSHSKDPSQRIDHYEISLGNDRRYELTRMNVHSFVNVGLSRNHTFDGLNLTAKSTTYYVTVRAYSEAGSMTEVSSNGIKVGYVDYIKPGTVFAKMFQSSTKGLQASWEEFSSDLQIRDYQVCVSTDAEFITALSNKSIHCEDLQDQNNLEFNRTVMTSVGTDTTVKLSNLALIHGHKYYIVVKATDAASNCGIAASPPILIDTTPPLPGKVVVGLEGTNALYAVSTETLTATWSGFRDPETQIVMYEVSLFQRLVCSNIHLNDTELSLIKGPVEMTNDSTIEFTHLRLKPHVPYYVKLQASNEAGLSATYWSDPVFVDDTPPFPGDVKHGSNWKISDLYQASTTSLQGMIGIAQDTVTAICPSTKRIQFFSKHQEGMSVLKSSPRLSDIPQPYYQPDNVQTSSGQLVLLTGHDKYRFHLELAGVKRALSSDVLGNFSFFLQAAKGESIITSVTLSKGDNDEIFPFEDPVIVDLPSSDMFQNSSIEFRSDNITAGSVVVNGTNKNSTTTAQKDSSKAVHANITINGSANVANQFHLVPGVGLHILGYSVGSDVKWYCMFWCTNEDGRESEWVELSFDPTSKAATYTIQIEEEDHPTRTSWNAKLHINNEFKAAFFNIIKPKGFLKIRTWSRNDFVPGVVDVFYPFQTQAALKYLEIPLPRDKPCHFGKPFYDLESKLKELWVGVGRYNNLVDDVIPLHLYKRFCSPCQYECDMTCSPECPLLEFPQTVLLKNLTLAPEREKNSDDINQDSATPNAAVYFMIIKTINHAGLETTVSSQGITIDTTPPNCTLIHCLDPSYSMEEPVEYVGTNESIGAYWDCEEDISDIIGYDVALGTTPGHDNIISFYSVGLNNRVILNNFTQPLQQYGTYYVSVRAKNAAGQSTMATCYVAIDTEVPSIAGLKDTVKPPGVSPLPNIPGVYATDNSHETALEWAKGSETVEYYEWQIGSADGESDIFPRSKIGVTNSTKVAILNGKLIMNDVDANMSISVMANHSASNKSNEDIRKNSFFSMEPGRCLHQSLIATSKAHKSALVANLTTCIKRPKDTVMELKQEGIKLVLRKDMSHNANQKGGDQANTENVVDIQVKGDSGSVLAGLLSVDDFQAHYGSAASATFNSYIQDPVYTANEVSRTLHQRIRGTTDTSFFVSPAGHAILTDNLEVEVEFDPDSVRQGLQPELIYWNTETRRWHQINEDCDVVQSVDFKTKTIRARVCRLNQPRHDAPHKRSTSTQISPTQLALVIVSPDIVNNPPTLTTTDLYLMEDQKDFSEILSFHDPEDDDVLFELARSPHHGYANVSSHGVLSYIPKEDFSGTDKVTVRLTEVTSAVKNIRTHSVTSEVKLHVNGTNDPALLYFRRQGSTKKVENPTTVNLSIEGRTELKYLGDLILFDPDKNERLRFIANGLLAENYTIIFNETKNTEQNYFHEMKMNGSVKVAKLYINSSRYFHGEVTFNVTGKDSKKRSPFAPMVFFHVYVLANPCEFGQCLGDNHDRKCAAFGRSTSFNGYSCLCDPGYHGQRCESEINECAVEPCPTFYDCVDKIAHHECILNHWKLPVTCVFLLLAGISLLVGAFIFKKKLASNTKVKPLRRDPDVDTVSMKEVMRWQQEPETPTAVRERKPNPQIPTKQAVYSMPGSVDDLEVEDADNPFEEYPGVDESHSVAPESDVTSTPVEPPVDVSSGNQVEEDADAMPGLAMLTGLMAPVGAVPRPKPKLIQVQAVTKHEFKEPQWKRPKHGRRPGKDRLDESSA
ncbi:uncharacterized protein LOC106161555, partial [Lingula anatina]|uniref:Uncharacterized protein LOC106161555 n=1 Tax=Lingula anatina TaxID=7574 RepID=A0A1S3I6U8_LINAN